MESVKRLRGPKGTKVTITVMREGLTKPKDFTLVREVIPIRSVRHELLEQNYGYIRISQFQEKTDSELDKHLKALEDESKGTLKGLIVDLRNNPGGALGSGRQGGRPFYRIRSYRFHGRKKRGSEGEILRPSRGNHSLLSFGRLDKWRKCKCSRNLGRSYPGPRPWNSLGTQTFGKGSVQTIFPLKDGSGLRLTTARYFTPNGRSIQAKGIMPDITVKPSEPGEEKVTPTPKQTMEKDLERHLIEMEKEQPKEKEVPKKDEVKEKKPVDQQRERALELLKSWEIFKKIVKEGK